MSGHNKWSKIKHKKALTDAKKSKVFSKFVKLIQVESKLAKGDVNSPGLKAAIEKAKRENVPKDNIERAVKKGASSDSATMESVTYEAYGPGGVGIIIEALTDNKNRSGSEIKSTLTKAGTSLAAPGSATWAFEKKEERWSPTTTIKISEEENEKLQRLIESLEELDDVEDIYTNKE